MGKLSVSRWAGGLPCVGGVGKNGLSLTVCLLYVVYLYRAHSLYGLLCEKLEGLLCGRGIALAAVGGSWVW